MADEATDCSMKEQLALIFRFVNKKTNIREEFVSFLEYYYGLSGQSLYRTIKEFLVLVGIDISDCRGQDYDGAGEVAGKNQGLSAHILRKKSKNTLHKLFLPLFEFSLLWRTTCLKPSN